MTGGKGLPVATRARPSVHLITSSGTTSVVRCRVGHRHDHRTVDIGRGGSYDRFGERSTLAADAYESGRFGVGNDFFEIPDRPAGPVGHGRGMDGDRFLHIG